LKPYAGAWRLLQTIPGIDQISAAMIVIDGVYARRMIEGRAPEQFSAPVAAGLRAGVRCCKPPWTATSRHAIAWS
jgi:hypothetical protein